MEETKYIPKNNLHNRGYIDMYVTNGIEIKNQNYIIVEYKVIGESLYAILTQDFVTYYKQLLTGISEQETFDDTDIQTRLSRLENLPQYRYDDSYLRGKVDDIESHSAEYESTTNTRLELLESNAVRPGKSAYDLWLDQGNTGTEEDFFESLRGIAGTRGVTFTPHISEDYVLSWTNDGGLDNPRSIVLSNSGSGTPVDPEDPDSPIIPDTSIEEYTEWIYTTASLGDTIRADVTVAKSTLNVTQEQWEKIKPRLTMIYDSDGSLGYVKTFDKNSSTLVVSVVGAQPTVKNGIRLGTVEHKTDLPTTFTALDTLGWTYANIGDFVYVLEDSTHDNVLAEYYISDIDNDNATVTWAFSHAINVGEYQLQTEASMSGKLLTGGAEAGTFGTPVPVETFQTATVASMAGKILTGGATPGTFGEPFDPSTMKIEVDELTEADVISIWNSVE